MIRRTNRGPSAVILLGTVGLAATVAFGSSAAVAADDDGIGISVTVSPAPSDPASGSSGAGAGSGSGTSGSPGSTTVPGRTGSSGSSLGTGANSDAVAPVVEVPALEDDEVDLGGALFVSGVTSSYHWSPNPLAGESETRLEVRNVSTSTFSSTVHFWADGPFGNRLSEVKGVRITALKPGESRVVDASLGGIGQFTFVQLHATLTPPKSVDGVELASVTRDQFVVIPPWAILSLLVLGGIGYAIYALVKHLNRPYAPAGLVGAPA